MKYKPNRPNVRTRTATPLVNKKSGKVEIMCPFCKPSHPIFPDKVASCGTQIIVSAQQVVILSHYAKEKKYKCLKCGETGGEMVMSGTGFVHLADCKPEMKLLNDPPPVTKRAEWVFHLPLKVRAMIEARTGEAKELQEIDEKGQPTGKVLGYFFYKG